MKLRYIYFMTLKSAFIISVLMHIFVIAPLYGSAILKPLRPDKEHMTVDYVVIKEAEEKKVVQASIRSQESPKLEIAKNIDLKPALPVNTGKQAQKKAVSNKAREDTRKEARVRSTRDYINYYQLLREKIKDRLKENYKSYYREGDVTLTFILNADGTLNSVTINPQKTTEHKALRDIAVSSVKEAAPYPAFPKALNLPRMSFGLQISFKKE